MWTCTDAIIKCLSTTKSPHSDGFKDELLINLKKTIKLFESNTKQVEKLPNSFHMAAIIWIPNLDENSTRTDCNRPILSIIIDLKISNCLATATMNGTDVHIQPFILYSC